MANANEMQVGGKHYGGGAYQHWDMVVQANENRYLEGQNSKYLCRYTEKNGKEDLDKSYHYLVKLIECAEAGLISPPYPKSSIDYHLGLLRVKYSLTKNAEYVIRCMMSWQSVGELRDALMYMDVIVSEYVPTPIARPTQDEWLMGIAIAAAKGATCPRRSVGCVLADAAGAVIAVACNGVATDTEPCDRKSWTCAGADAPSGTGLELCEAIHAEQRALIQVNSRVEIRYCYTTTSPCMHCAKMLKEAGILSIIFAEEYVHPQVKEYWLRDNEVLGFKAFRWIHLPVKK